MMPPPSYQLIEKVIALLVSTHPQTPSLEALATEMNLSPAHLQKLFTQWAGVSPKKFAQFISLQHCRHLLRVEEQNLFSTAFEAGLSGTGRLHHLFVTLQAMTPAEFARGGRGLAIDYRQAETLFGPALVATTGKGICFLAFGETATVAALQAAFPQAVLSERTNAWQEAALSAFETAPGKSLPLHVMGTPFQLQVWEALLRIPEGQLSTYGQIARQTGHPQASRAVGTAIGSNPVAWLIPCHRVIQSSGVLGGYRWQPERKQAMIGWEQGRVTNE